MDRAGATEPGAFVPIIARFADISTIGLPSTISTLADPSLDPH
jgi:hypothetical protein